MRAAVAFLLLQRRHVPPPGFVFLVDSDGAYMLDSDGAYLVEPI